MSETVPLPPIADDLDATMRRAIAHNERITAYVNQCAAEGLKQIYLVGSGGSLCATVPAKYALDQWERTVSVDTFSSDEFSHLKPARLDGSALVVLASHSGKTAETVRALETAKSAGAHTIAITRSEDSPLAVGADLALTYESETTIWPANQTLFILIAYAIMDCSHRPGEFDPGRDAFRSFAGRLGELLAGADESLAACAEVLHENEAQPIYVLSSGPNMGAGYALTMCYLQEMQWLHAISLNAGEFLHGALEAIDEQTPVIILLGDDPSREIATRSASFVAQNSKVTQLIDAGVFELPDIPQEERGQVTPVILTLLVQRLVQHLAHLRDHSMKKRRYMGKVSY